MTSCGHDVKYRPLIYGHDYKELEIIEGGTHRRIYCGNPEFNKYISMEVESMVKIATILKNAKIPWYIRLFYKKEIDSIIEGVQNLTVR